VYGPSRRDDGPYLGIGVRVSSWWAGQLINTTLPKPSAAAASISGRAVAALSAPSKNGLRREPASGFEDVGIEVTKDEVRERTYAER
jgi:hypothetical protein